MNLLLMFLFFICIRTMLVCSLNMLKLKQIDKEGLAKIQEIQTKVFQLIYEGKEWKHLYDEFDGVKEKLFEPISLDNTIKNIFDLTKWTYKQMFGEDM